MELFIFIAFQLLIEVQSNSSLQKPFISVSDDGVQINIACEIPDSVRADFTCSLYTEDDLLHSQRKQSGERLCMFYLTPGELFTRSVSRQLSCDYSLNTEPEIRSPRSDTQTIRGQNSSHHSDPVTVQSSTTTTAAQTNTTSTAAHPTTTTSTAQTTTTTSTAQTTTTSTAQTTTTTTSTAHPTTTTSTAQTTTATTAAHPTTTTSTAHTTRTATTSRVSSVHTSTAGPKDHQLTPLHRETWFIVLVSTGVGVILTGFICLCRFASKKRRKHNKMRSITSDVPSQEIGMSSGPAETYSLITSVPVTSQPMWASNTQIPIRTTHQIPQRLPLSLWLKIQFTSPQGFWSINNRKREI
ncbi:cell wall protein DAN4-like isoform X3 [Megalobrama amblycephala]|uniref:cell wall protein DAN4-like isoform X3 n=1 Tax=Megalobrama amblycephala TaxID=75352 RepID=UPI00201418C8|nr:cell wall protein DAN4-like isoform X3 [Megalobrama amblycephala]